MNKYLNQLSSEESLFGMAASDEPGWADDELGADEVEEKVFAVSEAVDLLKVPPPPKAHELKAYQNQIKRRIKHLETEVGSLRPSPRKRALKRKLQKLKRRGSANILENLSPLAYAAIIGGAVTAATPVFAQSYYRRQIDSPAQALPHQAVDQWDEQKGQRLYRNTNLPVISLSGYKAFYAGEFTVLDRDHAILVLISRHQNKKSTGTAMSQKKQCRTVQVAGRPIARRGVRLVQQTWFPKGTS